LKKKSVFIGFGPLTSVGFVDVVDVVVGHHQVLNPRQLVLPSFFDGALVAPSPSPLTKTNQSRRLGALRLASRLGRAKRIALVEDHHALVEIESWKVEDVGVFLGFVDVVDVDHLVDSSRTRTPRRFDGSNRRRRRPSP